MEKPPVRTHWHGLLLEFSVTPLSPGPGLLPDFAIEEVELVKLADESEFREEFPIGTPEEVFGRETERIEEDLYFEVLEADDE